MFPKKFLTAFIGIVFSCFVLWMVWVNFVRDSIKPHEGFISRPMVIVGKSIHSSYDLPVEEQGKVINKLWEKFYSKNFGKIIPNANSHSRAYGVYSNYGDGGRYMLTAGVEVTSVSNKLEDFDYITIPVGKYMVFSKKSKEGFKPQLVVDAWNDVDQYFLDSSKFKRDYNVDFEVYFSDGVDVYISYSEK